MDADIVIEPIADSSPVVYICYSWAMYGEVSLASEFQVETIQPFNLQPLF